MLIPADTVNLFFLTQTEFLLCAKIKIMKFTELKKTLNIRGRVIVLKMPLVMGIINLTPDSFYDGGRLDTIDDVIRLAEKHLNEGAFFLDIGGCSTRPGAVIVSEEEEMRRVLEPVYHLSVRFPEAVISIDTMRKSVAKAAIGAGAAVVNDISAGEFDPEMLDFIASSGVPYIIMHKKGMPENMQLQPEYQDVTSEVFQYFENKIHQCRQKGICDLIIDPGFGFGKTIAHNYTLLKNLDIFKILGLPILVGISRKSMIYKALNQTPEEALNGTSVLHTLALMKGAGILRVHDVREAVEVVKLVNLFQEN